MNRTTRSATPRFASRLADLPRHEIGPRHPLHAPRAHAPTVLVALVALVAALLSGAALAKVTVTDSLSKFHAATPGAEIEGSIRIRNGGAENAEVRLYQTDYRFFADGSNLYDPVGSHPRSNGDWVELAAEAITVAPGESVTASYRVRVPDRADLSGSYWSVIMVEEVVPEAAPDAGAAVSMRTVVRYGVQIVTDVDGGGERSLVFARPELLDDEADGTVLRVDVENPGAWLLRPEYYAEVFDTAGASLGRVPGEPKRVYPDTSVRERFALGDLAPGRYTVIVVADAGGDDVFGARYTLDVTP